MPTVEELGIEGHAEADGIGRRGRSSSLSAASTSASAVTAFAWSNGIATC
jgi:hypothetical protein